MGALTETRGTSELWKSLSAGAVLALLFVLAVSVGVYFNSKGGVTPAASSTGRVLVVFVSPAEDGANVAQLIAEVAGGRLTDVSADMTVTVPGTSEVRLGDAYSFGGGAAVAAAVGKGPDGRAAAYVVVPELVWRAAVDRTDGVQVRLPRDVSVFDGSTLTVLRAGDQTLRSAAVAGLLRGLPYLPSDQRTAVRADLERGLSAAVATGTLDPATLQTDLPPETVRGWMTDVLLKAAGR